MRQDVMARAEKAHKELRDYFAKVDKNSESELSEKSTREDPNLSSKDMI